ncbi:MAG: restriction endonuclease [Desulfobacteraceae bacterium]|nr:restriction endonuclease [Desulfobacteraceae bacterium]
MLGVKDVPVQRIQLKEKNGDLVGGIDLDPNLLNLQIKRDQGGIPLPIAHMPLEELEISGFVPLFITPQNDLARLLGLAPLKSDDFIDLSDGFRATLEARKESEATLRLAVQEVDRECMEYLKKNPKAILQTSGHLFEKIIAEILASLGFDDISLNVRTEAGETDIIGFSKDVFGKKIGYLFELKQLSKSNRKVELQEVTRLYGMREALKTSLGIHQGVFVTTTNYTKDARHFGEVHSFSLEVYDNIEKWLKEYKMSSKGLYLR